MSSSFFIVTETFLISREEVSESIMIYFIYEPKKKKKLIKFLLLVLVPLGARGYLLPLILLGLWLVSSDRIHEFY
jgi:hypothetical protein